jgi:hypothetical protein
VCKFVYYQYRPYSRDRTFDFKTRLLVQGGIDLSMSLYSGERKKNELALQCTFMYNDTWYSNEGEICFTNFKQNNTQESKYIA